MIGGVGCWKHAAQPASDGGTSNPKAARDSRPQPVSVAEAKISDMRVWLNALGTVTPRELGTVHTQVDGTLLRMNFHEGQMVEAGELLAEIDPRPFQLALDQAKGQLARDKALLDDALVDLARYKGLLARDAIPGQQADALGSLVRQRA